MVSQKIMLSPCMVCENEEIYDWMLLNDTLDFIDRYLECGLDSIEGYFSSGFVVYTASF